MSFRARRAATSQTLLDCEVGGHTLYIFLAGKLWIYPVAATNGLSQCTTRHYAVQHPTFIVTILLKATASSGGAILNTPKTTPLTSYAMIASMPSDVTIGIPDKIHTHTAIRNNEAGSVGHPGTTLGHEKGAFHRGDGNLVMMVACLSIVLLVGQKDPSASAFHRNLVSRYQARERRASPLAHAIPSFYEPEEDSGVTTTPWNGAGGPRHDLPPEELPSLLMTALRQNDAPTRDAGLVSMWEFAGDTTRHVFRNDMAEFIESAHETAARWPTSFYGAAMKGSSLGMEGPLNRVGGDDGWIATQVMRTVCSDGRVRRWQWEIRRHRRPPNLGAWYVESIGSSDREGNFEAED